MVQKCDKKIVNDLDIIRSKDNKFIKQVRNLQNKKERLNTGLFVAEGLRNIGELVKSNVEIQFCLYTEKAKGSDVLEKIKAKNVPCYECVDFILNQASDTKECAGIICCAKQENYTLNDLVKTGKIIGVLDGVSDPGNVGTIARTAWAAGLGGLVLLPNCVDIYNPKVVRSTMGAIYNLPIAYGNASELNEIAKKSGYEIVSVDMGGEDIFNAKINDKTFLVLGSEAQGVSNDIRQIASSSVAITMADGVESLNVAVAGGIIFFAAKRKF